MVLTELGETCEDRGLASVEALECAFSTELIKTYYPTYEEPTLSDIVGNPKYPSGCYVYVSGSSYKGYFNPVQSGSNNDFCRPLCKETGGRKLKKGQAGFSRVLFQEIIYNTFGNTLLISI